MDLRSKEAKWALALIIIGLLALLDGFGAIDLWGGFWRLWPVLLIVWGFSMLRKRGRAERHEGRRVFGDTVETTDSPFVNHSSAFGDISISIRNEEFSGGSASTVFGTISLDLSGVARITGYGQLDLHAVFGDIAVKVPGHLPVEVRSSSVFGDVKTPGGGNFDGKTYRSPGAAQGEKTLVIDCSQVFGDVEVVTAE
jgi:predicted membrane protein